MPITCLSKDELLLPPQGSLEFPSYGQQSPPFTLSGAPIGIPQPVVGAVEKRRKPQAIKETSNLQSYFAADNYYEINLATQNILEPSVANTLRFRNSTYQLFFAAVHAGVWGYGLQVSLVFQDPSQNFFHICIPIQTSGTPDTENTFLASWLGRVPAPQGLTMNELLNFRGSEKDVRFATLEYCLKYNVNKKTDGSETSTIRPYTLCIFNTPLQIRANNVPAWLSRDPGLTVTEKVPDPGSQETYRRKSFDDIFNYMMRGRINQFIYSNPDPYLIGTERHFATTGNVTTQNIIMPAYFKVNSNSLSRIAYSAQQLKEGVRGLRNVKCYPIDLASQVDDGGNIYIDDTKNTPINVNEVLSTPSVGATTDVTKATQDALNAQVAAAQNISTIKFWLIIFGSVLIIGAIIIVIVVYFFQGRGSPPPVEAPVALASGVAPLAVASGVAPVAVASGVAPIAVTAAGAAAKAGASAAAAAAAAAAGSGLVSAGNP